MLLDVEAIKDVVCAEMAGALEQIHPASAGHSWLVGWRESGSDFGQISFYDVCLN